MLQVVAVDLANWVFQALRQPDLVRVHEDHCGIQPGEQQAGIVLGMAVQALDGRQLCCAEDKAQSPSARRP